MTSYPVRLLVATALAAAAALAAWFGHAGLAWWLCRVGGLWLPAGEEKGPMKTDEALLLVGEAAKRCGCDTWHVVRVYQRGLMPPAKRLGRNRAIPESDLPALRAALKEAGYLKS